MKKEDLVEITLAMVNLDKHYQSLTSYALASEKKRKKIDKAVAKLIHLIHQSDEYCADHESAIFVINQLNESKVDLFYRPNVYVMMSNARGENTQTPKEFNTTKTEEILANNTIIDHIENEDQLKLVAKRYGFDFDDAVKQILREANSEKLSAVKFIGTCDTNEYSDSTFTNREVGNVVYVIDLESLRLKYDSITERCILVKLTAHNKHADDKLNPDLPIIDKIEDMENDAEEYHIDFDDLYAWVVFVSFLTGNKKFKYSAKIDTLNDLENRKPGNIYYCDETKTMHIKYDDEQTGAQCSFDYKNAPKDNSKARTDYRIGNVMNLVSLAKENNLNLGDMVRWIREVAEQKKYKSVTYSGEIRTLTGLKGKPKGEIYYCSISKKLYMKYGTGQHSYIASPKF